MDYKKAFFSKLEDCYLGAKINSVQNGVTQNSADKAHTNSVASGADIANVADTNSKAQSGFTNLLHIKAILESLKKLFSSYKKQNNPYFFMARPNKQGLPYFVVEFDDKSNTKILEDWRKS